MIPNHFSKFHHIMIMAKKRKRKQERLNMFQYSGLNLNGEKVLLRALAFQLREGKSKGVENKSS